MSSLYFERQRGGLCRLHSLNHFFGRRELTEADFLEAADVFDNEQRRMFGADIASCRNFDLINSDQRNLVTYILSTYGIYSRYVALNQHHSHIEDAIKAGRFFIYNHGHIWAAIEHAGAWHVLDSLNGGPTRAQPRLLSRQKNIGLIIPIWEPRREFDRLVGQMRVANIDQYIRDQNAQKRVLGELEVQIGAAMQILRIQNAKCPVGRIKKLIDVYDCFIMYLSHAKLYNNLDFLLKYLPRIYTNIMAL
jgi:hypothetical protein